MTGSLLFLVARGLRGRVVQVLRKLREPRYLVGALITGAWLLFVFGGSGGDLGGRFGPAAGTGEGLGAETARALHVLLGVLLAAVFTVWWLVPWGRRALELDEAELHVLLPAPLPRRTVIQYAVLKGQSGVLVGTVVLAFFWGGGGVLDRLATLPAFWTLLTLWDLHGKARALWLARQREIPPGRARLRRGLLLAVLAGFWVIAGGEVAEILTLALAHPWQEGAASVPGLLEAIGRRTLHGPLAWASAPFVWATEPLAHRLRGGGALPSVVGSHLPALALLLIHNEWVVRSQVRFEEATLAQARQRARQSDPASRFWKISRRRRRRVPFSLVAEGRAETAILWKNLILFRRGRLRTLCGVGALAALGLALVVCLPGVPGWLPWGAIFVAGASLPLGPMVAGRSLRNDLRTDLLKLELVRPWPVASHRLFAAEIAAPVTLAMLQVAFSALLLLTLDLAITLGALPEAAAARSRVAAALGAPGPMLVPLALLGYAPLALVVAALGSALENLAALLFPSWVQLGLRRKQAAAGFGQNVLVFVVLSLAFGLGLLPGVLAAGLFLGIQWLVWGLPPVAWELPLLGFLAALPVGAVVTALIVVGGRLWERLDPSDELLSGRA